MIRGLYTAASGLVAAQHVNDTVANNLANVNTPGYKKDLGIIKTFNQVLIERLEKGFSNPIGLESAQPVGSMVSGAVTDQVVTIFSEGTLSETGKSTDLAIAGPGYFQVATPNGMGYTRSGNFIIDGKGNLVTNQGYLVMGSRGPIRGLTGRNLSISPDGTVINDGQIVDRLEIVDFFQGNLRKEGDNLFVSQGQPVLIQNPSIKQGFLEQSNVDLSQEMVNMMSVLRSYEANQKVVQTMDSTLDKAVNEVGKI